MQMGASIGDVGIAIHPLTGRSMAFAFADTGTVGHLGESSITSTITSPADKVIPTTSPS